MAKIAELFHAANLRSISEIFLIRFLTRRLACFSWERRWCSGQRIRNIFHGISMWRATLATYKKIYPPSINSYADARWSANFGAYKLFSRNGVNEHTSTYNVGDVKPDRQYCLFYFFSSSSFKYLFRS